MNILHVAAHLGGGVGKAHVSLCRADPAFVKRHYVLLEAPRDMRYTEMLQQLGVRVSIAPDLAAISLMAAMADVVQVEWWNHPRIYEVVCKTPWPKMRTLFWSHISGITAPYIPSGLVSKADCFAFTARCSLDAPNIADLPAETRRELKVINSGFGFDVARGASLEHKKTGSISYLGTVNFSKMSPALFHVADHAASSEAPVSIWGNVDPTVMSAADSMRNRGHVAFMGHSAEPEQVFAGTSIFLYLLQPHHFGTAENALIEAMSYGCAPIVFSNPAEAAIVENGQTGFVVNNAEEAIERLRWMRQNPAAVRSMGQNARHYIEKTKSPQFSSAAFVEAYRALMSTPKRHLDFRSVLGDTAADWFLSTQILPESPFDVPEFPVAGPAAKGTISHFLTCFPDDETLLSLARAETTVIPLRTRQILRTPGVTSPGPVLSGSISA